MGLVRVGPAAIVGPPKVLMARLRDAYDIPLFVETGTFLGETALWAATIFPRVVTVEKSPVFHEQAVRRLANARNVECMLGDSRALLGEITASLDSPTIFWLDAHWSTGSTYGSGDECPILDELDALSAASAPCFLFIDDARYFTKPPPPPHHPENWPPLADVIDAVRKLADPYIVIHDDVIVAVPRPARGLVVKAVREGTASTLEPIEAFRQGVKLIAASGRLAAGTVWGRRRRARAH